MDQQDRELFLIIIDLLDKIRKNTEKLLNGSRLASSDQRVDKLLGRHREDRRPLDDKI